MSAVVRVPDDLYESARRFAALQGRHPGEVLADAWEHYVRDHRDQLADDLEQVAKLLRAGEVNGFAKAPAPSGPRKAV